MNTEATKPQSGADSEVIRFKRIAAKVGIDKARERASAYLASRFIGRKFGESAESFYAAHPQLVALREWARQ